MPADDTNNTVGLILALNTTIPCFLAAICFYMAGAPYSEFKVAAKLEKEEVDNKCEELEINLRTLSVASLALYEPVRRPKKAARQVASSMYNKKRPLLEPTSSQPMASIDEESGSEVSFDRRNSKTEGRPSNINSSADGKYFSAD